MRSLPEVVFDFLLFAIGGLVCEYGVYVSAYRDINCDISSLEVVYSFASQHSIFCSGLSNYSQLGGRK